MRLPLPPAAALSPQGDEVLPQMSRDAERESGFSRVNERILGSRVSGPAPWEKAPRIRGAETGSGGGQNQGIGAPGEGEGLGAGKEGGLETEWCGWRGWTDERTDGRKEGQVVVAAGLGLTSLAASAGHRASAPQVPPLERSSLSQWQFQHPQRVQQTNVSLLGRETVGNKVRPGHPTHRQALPF